MSSKKCYLIERQLPAMDYPVYQLIISTQTYDLIRHHMMAFGIIQMHEKDILIKIWSIDNIDIINELKQKNIHYIDYLPGFLFTQSDLHKVIDQIIGDHLKWQANWDATREDEDYLFAKFTQVYQESPQKIDDILTQEQMHELEIFVRDSCHRQEDDSRMIYIWEKFIEYNSILRDKIDQM